MQYLSKLSQASTYGFNVPKITKHLLVVAKLVPGLTYGTADGQYEAKLDSGITRKYAFVVEGINDRRSAYLTQTVSLTDT